MALLNRNAVPLDPTWRDDTPRFEITGRMLAKALKIALDSEDNDKLKLFMQLCSAELK